MATSAPIPPLNDGEFGAATVTTGLRSLPRGIRPVHVQGLGGHGLQRSDQGPGSGCRATSPVVRSYWFATRAGARTPTNCARRTRTRSPSRSAATTTTCTTRCRRARSTTSSTASCRRTRSAVPDRSVAHGPLERRTRPTRCATCPSTWRLAPFDDIHVRKAVNWAFDKEGFRQLRGGPTTGELAGHIFVNSLQNDILKDYDPYPTPNGAGDLEKAKEEMAQSKYDSDGDGVCDDSVLRGHPHDHRPRGPVRGSRLRC